MLDKVPPKIAVSAAGSSVSSGSVVFSNSNGMSFGMAGSTITGSYTVPGATVFSNSNNVSFGLNGSTITATATVPSSAFSGGISGGNTSGNTGTVSNQMVLAGGNNITLSGSTNTGGMSLTISGVNTVAQTNQSMGIYGSSQTTGQSSSSTIDARSMSLVGMGGMSVGMSGGSVLLSCNQTVAQSNQTEGRYAVGNTTGQSSSTTYDARTMSVAGAGIVSAGYSAGSGLVISASQSNQTGNVYASSNTFGTSSGTYDARSISIAGSGAVSVAASNSGWVISAPTQSNQTGNIYAASQSTAQSSSSSYDPRSLSIAGMGGVSVGWSNSSLIISGATGGGGGAGFTAGFSTDGQTSGNSGMVTGQLDLVGTNGIGLSGSTNGGSMTVSIQPAPYISNWTVPTPFPGAAALRQVGNGSVQVWPIAISQPISITQVNAFVSVSVSSSSNSSFAGVINMFGGIYTRNGSTLSLATSGSSALQFTNTSNNSIANLTGQKMISFSANFNLTPGEYWFGFGTYTSTTNANWFTASNYLVQPCIANSFSGALGAATNNTAQYIPGWGQFSATSTVAPGSMAFNQISGPIGGGSTCVYDPVMQFCNVTF